MCIPVNLLDKVSGPKSCRMLVSADKIAIWISQIVEVA
jgi:hypothetical protein